jgi:dTDP-4-amino-4,6-dideoxygalactose transaminase
MKVPFATFDIMHKEIREEMIDKFSAVYDGGYFILGKEVDAFESEFAAYCNTKYCVSCANGLDAISLILRAMDIGEGDEVIIPSNTFIATALAVACVGATCVLVEPDEKTYNMTSKGLKQALTDKTKAIMPVHLYGQTANMDEIIEFADKHSLLVIEDAAQAHGATYSGRKAGSLADAAAFSFYPGKNLGALGDGGALVTNNKSLAQKARAIGNYGSLKKYQHKYVGVNSRLDEVHAGLLRIKLKNLDKFNASRQRIAKLYLSGINNKKIVLPTIGENRTHVWHIFAILCEDRDMLQQYLDKKDISTVCHYPIPIHKQQADLNLVYDSLPFAERISSQELSLPLYYGMTDEQVNYVINALNDF